MKVLLIKEKKKVPSIKDIIHFSTLIGVPSQEIYKYSTLTERYYKKKKILKKNGGIRILTIPCDDLKKVQKWILKEILYTIEVDESANGFITNRSIVTNAKKHLHQNVVYNLDLENFFPTIKIHSIYTIFKKLGYEKEICTLLSKLCTYNNQLPQGAPTSPYLSNIVLKKLDNRLKKFSQKMDINYSRYADDLTFSGNKISKATRKFIKEIIESEGFKINLSKERIAFRNNRQEVTGLIVSGNKLSVPRGKERYLRQQIYFCKTKGVFDNLLFQEKEEVSNYREHLYGLAQFIKMVDQEKGNNFLKKLDSINWQS